MAIELYRRNIRRFLLSIALLVALSGALSIASLSIGSSSFDDPVKVVRSLLGGSSSSDTVVSGLRVTRTLASYLTGASLGLAGLLIQTVTRNPLADPYILGLSTTSLFFVGSAILAAPDVMVYRENMIAVAFLGAVAGFVFTTALSRLAGGSATALVLSGIAVSSLFGGLSHLVLYIVQGRLGFYASYLLLGSVAPVLSRDLVYLVYPPLVMTVATVSLYKMLNSYLYGDDYARQIGFSPGLVRTVALVISSLLTASTIAVVGIVGFIGLASPHIARFLVGGADHRFTTVASLLVGGVLTLASDISARALSALYPGVGDVSLGVMTTVVGAPFLAYLVVRRLRG